LLEEGDNFLVTYPRRWMKSMNMQMILEFLRIEVDEKGNQLEENLR